ncbi:MAG TPA: hypothetical protein DEH78_33285 [Solibacterales bacterium]|nr:hypothetical protein [Bryobacterales bacterium]
MARHRNNAPLPELSSAAPNQNITLAELAELELDLARAGFHVERRYIVPRAPAGPVPTRIVELSEVVLAPDQPAQIHLDFADTQGHNAGLVAQTWREAGGGIAAVARLWEQWHPDRPDGWKAHLMALPPVEAAIQEALRGGPRILFARPQ